MYTIIEVQYEPGNGITVKMNGRGPKILTGIAYIVNSFYKAMKGSGYSDLEAKAILREAVETGFEMSEETGEL